MLSERQRAILRRIHRLHRLIWLLLMAAVVLPAIALQTSFESLAPQTAVAFAIAAIVCITVGANTICPRCGDFFHSRRAIAAFFTERCASCRLSCRNPEANAE
jgi:hypothetical protein